MATIDLRFLANDQVVIYFGGDLGSVNAYTFANSLLALADTATSINRLLNPDQSIEVRLEAVGSGSLKALLRGVPKEVKGFLSRGTEALFWTLLGALIWQQISPDETTITVNANEVIYERNGDRVIVPRSVHEQLPEVSEDPSVRRGIQRTFGTIEDDEAVDSFGLTRSLSDEHPILQVPRSRFARLSELPPMERPESRRRQKMHKAVLVVTKAWLSKRDRKWAFEWNEVPIAAKISDSEFWDKVDSHEIVFGQGDALDVELECEQTWDETHSLWLNDPATFEVTRVIKPMPRATQVAMGL